MFCVASQVLLSPFQKRPSIKTVVNYPCLETPLCAVCRISVSGPLVCNAERQREQRVVCCREHPVLCGRALGRQQRCCAGGPAFMEAPGLQAAAAHQPDLYTIVRIHNCPQFCPIQLSTAYLSTAQCSHSTIFRFITHIFILFAEDIKLKLFVKNSSVTEGKLFRFFFILHPTTHPSQLKENVLLDLEIYPATKRSI